MPILMPMMMMMIVMMMIVIVMIIMMMILMTVTFPPPPARSPRYPRPPVRSPLSPPPNKVGCPLSPRPLVTSAFSLQRRAGTPPFALGSQSLAENASKQPCSPFRVGMSE
jgi:hypothetical protein